MHVVIYFSELKRLCRSSRGFLISLFQWIFYGCGLKFLYFFHSEIYFRLFWYIYISLSFIHEYTTIKWDFFSVVWAGKDQQGKVLLIWYMYGLYK